MSGLGGRIFGGLGIGAIFVKLCLVLSDCGAVARVAVKGVDYGMTAADIYEYTQKSSEVPCVKNNKRKKIDYNPHDPVAMDAAYERIERYNDSMKMLKYQDILEKAMKNQEKKDLVK